MQITLPYLTRTGSSSYWIWIFFGCSIFPDKMKTTYIAIFPAYKLVTSTACPYPNFSFFVRFLGIWKAIKRYYRSIGLFQTFWISCIAFTSTPNTSLYHLKLTLCIYLRLLRINGSDSQNCDLNISCRRRHKMFYSFTYTAATEQYSSQLRVFYEYSFRVSITHVNTILFTNVPKLSETMQTAHSSSQ